VGTSTDTRRSAIVTEKWKLVGENGIIIVMRKIGGYTVVVSRDPESRAFLADVPALRGCHTWAKTEAQAYRRALDAIETYLEAISFLGEKPPVEVSARRLGVG